MSAWILLLWIFITACYIMLVTGQGEVFSVQPRNLRQYGRYIPPRFNYLQRFLPPNYNRFNLFNPSPHYFNPDTGQNIAIYDEISTRHELRDTPALPVEDSNYETVNDIFLYPKEVPDH